MIHTDDNRSEFSVSLTAYSSYPSIMLYGILVLMFCFSCLSLIRLSRLLYSIDMCLTLALREGYIYVVLLC
jgi:hypothetical protein